MRYQSSPHSDQRTGRWKERERHNQNSQLAKWRKSIAEFQVKRSSSRKIRKYKIEEISDKNEKPGNYNTMYRKRSVKESVTQEDLEQQDHHEYQEYQWHGQGHQDQEGHPEYKERRDHHDHHHHQVFQEEISAKERLFNIRMGVFATELLDLEDLLVKTYLY